MTTIITGLLTTITEQSKTITTLNNQVQALKSEKAEQSNTFTTLNDKVHTSSYKPKLPTIRHY
jgi:uncharacterized coiled-coil protein SlyX